MIPQWPLNQVVDATKWPLRSESSRRRLSSWKSSPSIRDLCEKSVISTEHDGENLFFCMVSVLIRHVTTRWRSEM